MAYATEADAAHLLTATTFGSTSINGLIGMRWNFDVDRVVHRADGNLGPTSRPANMLDLMAVLRTRNGNVLQAYTASAATLTFTFKKGNGGSVTVALGSMLAGTTEQEGDNDQGAYPFQQVYQCQTASPAVTVTQ
jgi:hypothetical protein